MSNDLNSFLFSTPEMTRVFSPQEQLRAMIAIRVGANVRARGEWAGGGGIRDRYWSRCSMPVLWMWSG